MFKSGKHVSEAAAGDVPPLPAPTLKIAKAGSLALVSDADAIIEIARRTTSAEHCSVAEVVAQTDKFPVFVCVWPDPPSVRGYGMEIVKAMGQPLAGAKGVKSAVRLDDVGAVFVRSRAFALEVARLAASDEGTDHAI